MLAGAAWPAMAQPSQIQFAVTNVSVLESNSLALIVTCVPATTATVNYSITDLVPPGAINHLSNTPLAGTITFTNSAVQLLPINTIYLAGVEGTLPLLVSLSNPSNAVLAAQSNVVVNVLDFDTVFRFANDAYNVREDDNEVIITVYREGGSNGPASVTFSTLDLGANDPQDYVGHPVGITLFFADGQTSNTITIPIIDDCAIETNIQNFVAILSNPSTGIGAASIINSNALVRIQDNDTPSGQVGFFYDPLNYPRLVGERSVPGVYTIAIPVDRFCGSGDIAVDYRVNYPPSGCPNTTNADFGADFRVTNPSSQPWIGTLTWLGTDRSRKFAQIDIIDDDLVELDETITITLFNARRINANTSDPQVRRDSDTYQVIIVFDDQPAGAGDRTYNTPWVFVQDPGANNDVYTVAFDAFGTLLGGDFTAVNTVPRNGIARVNAFGDLDTSFNPGSGADGTVTVIAVYSSNSVHYGKSLVGGAFSSFDGRARNGIVRLNSNGSLDTTFTPGNGVQFGDGSGGIVRSIAILADDRVVIGGDFELVNSVPRRNIARLNADGTLDPNFDPGAGANGTVWALALQDPPPLTVGDGRSGVGPAESRTNINTDANSGTISLFYDFYFIEDSIRVYYDGVRIYDSGLTNGAATVDIPYGPGNSTYVEIVVNEGSGDPGTVWDYIAIITTGGGSSKVLVGGDFTSIGGASRSGIARLNGNGTVDAQFSTTTGTDGPVYALLSQADKKIVLGGNFSTVGVAPRNGIARLNEDGSLDTTFNPGTGINGAIYTMAFNTNGQVFIGGEFTLFNGTSRTNMARLYADGTLDTSYQDNYYNWTLPGVYQSMPFFGGVIPGIVRALAVQPDGNIMVGGRFDYVGGGFSPDAVLAQRNYTRLIGGPNPGPGNLPGNIQFTGPLFTVDENVSGGVVNFTIQRLNGVLGSITGYVYTVDGSAVAGRDYMPVSQAVAWSSCEGGNVLLSVPILDNQDMDGNRDFNLVLAVPQGVGVHMTNNPALGFLTSTKITIVDNDFERGVLGFAAPYYYVTENGGNAVITVVRTNGSNGEVSVYYATSDGTARSGIDYTYRTGILRFPSGVTTQTFTVPISNDLAKEPEETVLLQLFTPGGGATLGRTTATLVITDNDNGPGSLSLSTNEYRVSEAAGALNITVRRTGGAEGTQAVVFVAEEIPGLANGAAVNGADFVGITNTLYFAHGELSKVVAIPILQDNVVEGPEMFQVSVFTNNSALGLLGVMTNALVILQDDDSYGVLQFLQPRFAINERETNAIITVVRQGGSSGIVGVDYATAPSASPDAAIEAIHYLGASGTLYWADGDVTPKTFAVPILYNPLLEGNRVLDLVLSNPSKAALGQYASGVLMIVDIESQNVPAGTVDTSFNPSPGVDNFVQAIAIQNDGKLIIGGDFLRVNGVGRNRAARLHVNGALDETFNPLGGFNDTVYAVAVQPDQKILVAGRFTMFDVTNRSGIARLNVDGRLDSFFNPGSGADNPVYAVAVFKDGRIALGGAFTTFRGVNRQNLVVLNTNGTVMTSFNTGTGPNGVVYALAYQPDGKLLVGGSFTKYNGQTCNRVARLNPDGSLDATFDVGMGPDDSVRALALQDDGRVVIGGLFKSVAGVARGNLARLTSAGALDAGFMAGVSGADGAVFALSLQSDGKVVVAGDFNRFNDVSRSRITRLFADGTTDPTINFGTGANGHIAAVVNQTDDQIVIGGGFTSFNEIPRQHLARLIGYKNLGAGRFEFIGPIYTVNEGVSNAVITVRRNWGTSNQVQVTYQTLAGTAAPGADYLPATGVLTFPQGETLQTFAVPIINDLEIEPVETVVLKLSDPTNLTLGAAGELDFQNEAHLHIVSDDNLIGFASPTFTVNENTVSGFAVITVTRQGSTNGFASVEVSVSNRTATAGLDFTNVLTTLTFAPGETVKYYFITIYDDTLVEGDETLEVALSNPSPGTFLGTSSAILTIVDNDFAAGELNFDSAVYAVNEFETNAVIRVVRTNGSSGVVAVKYATSDGTAKAPADYQARSGTLAFADGETVKTFNVPIVPDYLDETNETVFLRIFEPSGAAGVSIGNLWQATLVILNNPLTNGNFNFSATNYTAWETSGVATITVNRLFGSFGTVTVNYATTTNGTAVAGVNYHPTNGTLTWLNGDAAPKTFNIMVLSNNLVEGDLTVGLSIHEATGGASMGGLTNAWLTVRDQSVGPGFFTFVTTNYSVSELGTNAVVAVLRTNGTLGAASVDYATSDRTGVSGTDYLGVSGTLLFADGQTSNFFLVPIIERAGADLNKTVNLTLTNPTNAGLGQMPNAMLTIVEGQTAAGSVNLAFIPDLNGPVEALYIQTNSDNKILIAGGFTVVDANPRLGVARLNPNGTPDLVFDAGLGPNAAIRSIMSLPDGRVYVGGAFTSFGSVLRSYVARLLPDGSVDGGFVASPDNVVYDVAVLADGKVIIGGLFTSVGGQPRGFLARLHSDGTIDTNFLAGVTGADGVVRAVEIQEDGKILIAGDFNSVNGVSRPKVARLNADGSVDSSFNPGEGPSGSVRTMVIQGDGKILIGGLFTSVAGVSRGRLARLEADGSLDLDFNPGAGADEFVGTIAVQPDGKVLVGGGFSTINGYRRNRLARLNQDGSVDTTFNIGIGANNYVSSIGLQTDGRIVAGGGFTMFNGLPQKYLVRLNGGFNLGPGAFEFPMANFDVVENASNAVVTVVRSIGTRGEVRVNYATSDGSAIAGTDYGAVSGTLVFADGETVQTFTVPVYNNFAPTSNRVINLLLSNPQGGAELGYQPAGTLTIVEDDGIFGFELANFNVNESAGTGVVTVVRTAGSIGGGSVDFTMSDGAATGGQDYLPVSGTLVFTNGQTNALIFIPLLDDTLVEGDETVNLFLFNPTNATLGRSNAILTLVDNEFHPGVLGFSVASYSVNENGGSVNITVRRTGGSFGNVSVNFGVTGGSATAGLDYASTNGTLQFLDGEITKTFSIWVMDDGLSEGNETVLLTLSNPQGGAILDTNLATAVLNILDDDVTPGAFRFANTQFFVNENDLFALVTIVRTNGTTGDVTVDFISSGGTAQAGVDFVAETNTYLFTNGQVSLDVVVSILNDAVVEPDETINLRLANPTGGASLALPSLAALIIKDDESFLNFGAAAYSVNEDAGAAVITVVRTGGSGTSVSVNYATSDGTALGGSDYTPVSGILNFGVGETVKNISVPITDNSVTNLSKTVNLRLFGPVGSAVVGGLSNAVLTIVDNDSQVSLSATTYTVGESAGSVAIQVNRAGSLGVPISVNFSAGGGTASNGLHYVATNLTLFFGAGENQKTVVLPIFGNNVQDGNRTVNITLSLPSKGAIIVSGSALLTILDDDNSVIVAAGAALVGEGTAPANGTVDAGEVVTLSLALRNVGNLPATNVVATLLATNGVASPGPAQNYGTLQPNGPAISRSFTFTANTTNGALAAAVLSLQSGPANLGTVSYSFQVGTKTSRFANTNSIIINDQGPASVYPSTITVAGLNGQVSKVTVTVSNISHTFPRDVGMMLVGPDGRRLVLMSYAVGGWENALNGVTLTFDDGVTNRLPISGPVTSGAYQPTNYLDFGFPAPAPATPSPSTNLAVFKGANPNGVWSLYVMDQDVGDIGSILGGWSLAISTAEAFPPLADLALAVSGSAGTATVGQNFTYSVSVTNGGPAAATGVWITNWLPSGVAFVSANSTLGTVNVAGSQVTAQIGALNSGSGALLTVVVNPLNAGVLTNVAESISAIADPATANNRALLITTVNPATPPSLAPPSPAPGGGIQIGINGAPGMIYYVEASTNLVNWTRIQTNVLAGATGTFTDSATAGALRFYRIVLP